MNILLINQYAGSIRHGMEYRPYYMAREWVKLGQTVTIVAASFSHVRTKPPDIRGTLTQEEIDGIHYVWLKTPAYNANGIRRLSNIAVFLFQLYRYKSALLNKSKPHVIIASSTHPLDNIPARSIARSCHAHLVYEVHDLWPLSPIELGGMSPRHPFIRLVQWAEDYAYRNADHVVSLLPKAEEHMRAHGLKAGKFVYIPNGIDVAEWGDVGECLPDEHHQLIQELKKSGCFIVGYAGAHGVANALQTFVDAAKLMQDLPIAVLLVGQGPEKEKLRKRAESLQLKNVYFLPPVPKTCIPSLLASMDVLYIGLKKESIFRFGISPNKLLDYMMAARPVIQAIQAGNDLVTESGCGISIPAENAAAIRDAVLQFMQMPLDSRQGIGQKGREYVLTHHDYRILAEQFLSGIGL